MGYNFNLPPLWLNTISSKKQIGIRRLELLPTSHTFQTDFRIYSARPQVAAWEENWSPILNVEYHAEKPPVWEVGEHIVGPTFTYDLPADGNTFETTVEFIGGRPIYITKTNAHMYLVKYIHSYRPNNPQPYGISLEILRSLEKYETTFVDIKFEAAIIEQNETVEILTWLMSRLSQDQVSAFPVILNSTFNFDSNRGRLELSSDNYWQCHVAGIDYTVFDDPGIIEWLRFFNQELTVANYLKMINPHTSITFNEVWDRRSAFIHTTFSTSKRGYCGMHKDKWEVPTKRFTFNDDTSEFWIRFTTDGHERFLPRYCGMLFEFTFLTNFDNAEIVL
jgi:hypothetical protein